MSLCHKLWFSSPYIFRFQRRKPLKFQTMTFVRSKNISLKYQRFTTLGSKDIEIRKSEFVAKTQFLYIRFVIKTDKKQLCFERTKKFIYKTLVENLRSLRLHRFRFTLTKILNKKRIESLPQIQFLNPYIIVIWLCEPFYLELRSNRINIWGQRY